MSRLPSKIILCFILGGIFISSIFFAFPQTSKASVPVHETALLKEGPLDIAAYTIAKQLLRRLIREIVGWIRTGDLDGGPLFITNFRDFFYKTQEDAKTIFIESLLSPAIQATIPSPFRDIVTESTILALRTQGVHIPSTLTGILEDEDILYEDYSQSGLIGLFDILTMPQNNSFGRTMLALDDAEHEIAQRIAEANTETISYSGFKGYADCLGILTNIVQGDTCIKRLIKTPGINAKDLLSSVFESDIDTLEVADELSEIITAIVDRLITSVLDFALSDSSIDPFQGIDRTPPGGGGTTPPPPPPPPGGSSSITASNSCVAGAPTNTISWTPLDTQPSGLINLYGVHYCTGAGCLPLSTDPTACTTTIASQVTSCTHQNVVPGATYGYRVFTQPVFGAGSPITDVASATVQSCTP